jgi:aminomethyltransferase
MPLVIWSLVKDEKMPELKELPLKHLHEKAKARFGVFAGWNMPLTYPLGVMGEHLHTRQKAGLFDISHMQLFEMSGEKADQALERFCPISASLIGINESKYTFFLNDSAGIVDDLIITRYATNRFIIVANASRADIDHALLKEAAQTYDCTVDRLERVFIALQGPQAVNILKSHFNSLETMRFMSGRIYGDIIITRSGYTGEDGFEIALPVKSDFIEKLIPHEDVEWIGLAARDTLRLEAGLCLYGQDLTESITPLEAGLIWAIPKSIRQAGSFVGAEALKKQLITGAKQSRVGIIAQSRQPVRNGALITNEAGESVGTITSGGFGPSVQHPVAMAYVDNAALMQKMPLFVTVRESIIPLTIAPLPFVPHNYVKG